MYATEIFIAIVGGLLALVGLRTFFRRHFNPAQPGLGGTEPNTPTPLQKRARWGLGITIATIIAWSVGVLVGYRRL